MSESRIITIGNKKFLARIESAEEVIRPDTDNAEYQIKFRVSHVEHSCLYCGKPGMVRFLGTFISSVDGQEYPACICEQCEVDAAALGRT